MLKLLPHFPAVRAVEVGSVGYILSIPGKLSSGIYCMPCQNQRRCGHYHDLPSESYNGLGKLAQVSSSLKVSLPQLVNQPVHIEGFPSSNVLCKLHVVNHSRSVSVLLHGFYLSVIMYP